MKIRITTIFEAINYGGLLQAYALQEKIKELFPDDDVKIINYRPCFTEKDLKIVRTRIGNGYKKILHALMDLTFYKTRKSKIMFFQNFVRDRLCLTEPIADDTISNLDTNFDILISGSDQIWNPKITDGVPNRVYYGALNGKFKRISYASSMGEYILNDENADEILSNLCRYNHLAVRESFLAKRLENVLNRNVTSVLDPTLLLSNKEWDDKLALPSNRLDKKYIFVFSAAPYRVAKKLCVIAKQISNYTGMEIIVLGMEFKVKGTKLLRTASPEQFVDLIRNAEIVVTDSFHGTVFSVNYNKNFLSVTDTIRSERQIDFLQKIGLMDYYIDNPDVPIKSNQWVVNYSEANERLNDLKRSSMTYLEKAIKES